MKIHLNENASIIKRVVNDLIAETTENMECEIVDYNSIETIQASITRETG